MPVVPNESVRLRRSLVKFAGVYIRGALLSALTIASLIVRLMLDAVSLPLILEDESSWWRFSMINMRSVSSGAFDKSAVVKKWLTESIKCRKLYHGAQRTESSCTSSNSALLRAKVPLWNTRWLWTLDSVVVVSFVIEVVVVEVEEEDVRLFKFVWSDAVKDDIFVVIGCGQSCQFLFFESQYISTTSRRYPIYKTCSTSLSRCAE